MGLRQRRDKKRSALSPNQEAWLVGNSDCGFIAYQPTETLNALWEAYGDKERFCWDGKYLPEPIS